MDPIIEMLRDENNAIEQLTARREELKRKLEEHRSGNISAEETGRDLSMIFIESSSRHSRKKGKPYLSGKGHLICTTWRLWPIFINGSKRQTASGKPAM